MNIKSIDHLLDISNEIERPKFIFSGQNKLKPINSKIVITANPIKIGPVKKKQEVFKPTQKIQKQVKTIQKPLQKLDKQHSAKQENEELKKEVWRPNLYLEELANIGDFEDYINQDNEEREEIAKRLQNVLVAEKNQEPTLNITKKLRECKLMNDNPFELPLDKQQKIFQKKEPIIKKEKKIINNNIVAPPQKKIRKEIPQEPQQLNQKTNFVKAPLKTQEVPIVKRPISFNKSPVKPAVIPKLIVKPEKKDNQGKQNGEKLNQGKKNGQQSTWYCFRCEKYHDKDLHKKQKEQKQLNQQNNEKQNQLMQKNINNENEEQYSEEDDCYDNNSFIDDNDDRFQEENYIVQRELQKLQRIKRGGNYNKMGLEEESDNMEAGFDEIEQEENYSKYVGMKEDEHELKYLKELEHRKKNRNKL